MTDERRCPTCGRLHKRSTQANRRYWALVSKCVPLTFNGQRWSKRSWHEMFKDMFLPSRIVELPSGKSVVRDPDSSDLDTAEFNDFMTQVEVWCGERGIYLEE